jgi:IS30 family transposase
MGADLRHCVLTLVERVTGYLVIKKLTARTKEQAAAALAQSVIKLGKVIKTITLDNGTEFHDYEKVEKRFGVPFSRVRHQISIWGEFPVLESMKSTS